MPSSIDRASSNGEVQALIGVDWGTSSCRAYLIDAAGRVIDRVENDQGILRVQDGAFAQALNGMIGAWRRPGLPVLLSGMIGSRQGWIEVPYLPVPASFDAIGHALVRHPDDGDIHIVPGLAQDLPDLAPDVMRGEETQIIGMIGGTSARQLLVMPGTHSKWVLVEDQRVVWFATFMTGELFAVLKDHSILGRLMAPDGGDDHRQAFTRGLDARENLPGGLLQQLFGARTLGLFERLPEHALAAYLSGLLIGHEIGEALGNLEGSPDQTPILVIGSSALAERYTAALVHAGLDISKADDDEMTDGDAAARGHYHLARASGLLPIPKGETR